MSFETAGLPAHVASDANLNSKMQFPKFLRVITKHAAVFRY